MQTNRLRPIAEGELSSELLGEAPPEPRRVEAAATSVLFTALRALSQRTIVAIGNLFVLLTVASAFWLWLVTLPNPTVLQLVGLALYAILILSVNWLVLRRR